MALVRNEKLVPFYEEKKIVWTSQSKLWQIIGEVKQHPNDPSFPLRSITIYKHHNDHRKFVVYHIGNQKNREKVPAYVLSKYDEILHEISGRKKEGEE